MCTVTYLPIDQQSFRLTTNRDEQSTRSPHAISSINENGLQLLFPRDKTAGGTWIAIASNDRVVCLLNGAFHTHNSQPPYRKSRGVMVLEYFGFKNAREFFTQYDFEGMEPFTMIIYDKGELWEFRWDDREEHIIPLDRNQPYLWSSAKLYSEKARSKRQQWFKDWLNSQPDFSKENILDFHQNGGEKDDYNGFVINRYNIVQTVSMTTILKTPHRIDMEYRDLINGNLSYKYIDI